MKIGISVRPYSGAWMRCYDEKFKMLEKCGFSSVDYNICNTDDVLYTYSDSELERQMTSELSRATSANISFSQVHGPWRYPPCDLTPEDQAERMEKMKRSLLAASFLKCKYWVVHPIMPFGTDDLLTGNEEKTWEMNLSFMRELLAYAKQLGITVCLENMPMLSFSLAKPGDILRFVREIDDESFRICLDTGHVAVFEDLTPAEEARKLGKYIKVLHVHDNCGDKDAHLYPGLGRIDWVDFVKALNDIGFDGVFSLETAPSLSLDNDSFEAECKEIYDLANKIVNQ